MDKDIVKNVIYELNKMGLNNVNEVKFEEIRNKDGVYLYRVYYKGSVYVLKYFEKLEYTREIANYNVLAKLGLKTIKVIGKTENSLLLEDINASKTLRLGKPEDLSDMGVAKKAAAWYKKLHSSGERYVTENGKDLYRETGLITLENIKLIQSKSNTLDNKVWALILDNFDSIKGKISNLSETLTYNDFYWTNLIVAQDKSSAFMYDYNMMGAGYRYGDIRNVCASLSEDAQEAFLKAYGEYDKAEQIIDKGLCILVDLIIAYQREVFPNWSLESLEKIRNGELERSITDILNI